jgi:hypothetical protein
MVIIKTVNGDICNAKERYICQQCNCVTVKPHGLSKYIADRFPYANVYASRPARSANTAAVPDEPGTVVEMGYELEDGAEEAPADRTPTVLCMMGQWLPGKPGVYSRCYPRTHTDTPADRESWFRDCLDIIDAEGYGTVAVPFRIGCGLAGGNWARYKRMLEECKTKVVIYKYG